MFKTKLSILFLYLAFSSGVAYGTIELPPLLSDGMVLQQRSGVALWGRAGLNTDVWVVTSWNNKKYKTTSGAAGEWRLIIKTPKAGGPHHITISDGEEVRLSNVLIGEVWLCSGQSNMEMTFRGYGLNEPVFNQPGDEAKNPMIRLFTVQRATGGSPKEHAEGVWNESSPETARNFSAVAYQFGKILHDSLNVPIGLISSSWGGARIEFWMSENSLRPFPEVKILAGIDTMKAPEKAPTALYNGMIAPLMNYTIRGVIWYQGESNRYKPILYAKLLPAMVADWRKRWQNEDMPFYYVQIAPFAYPNDKEPLLGALMREAQLKAQKEIPHSGIAVIMDAGSELKIHPPDKGTVSQRLAYHALAKTYNQKGIAYESPSYRSMESYGDKVIISFDHAGRGLKSSRDQLLNFEIAGTDKVFYPATASILPGGKVEVWNEAVTSPVAVRYAFKNWAKGDLYNGEGLPASSFRTDSWEIRKHLPPAWISQTPIVFIGNWDAMPIFRRRVGGNPVWQEEEYRHEHTEEAVKRFKEMGVTMALIHFYKGFGLEAEREHIEEAKKLAALCKENGIKVGVYIGSTVGYETFLLEKPDAADWFVPDFLGSPVRYGSQEFRKRVYFMHPGFIDYMKRVLSLAIQDLEIDLIHFDNTSIRAQPAIFHHPMAVVDFRDFLRKKYSPDLLKIRLGFSDVRFVEPPIGDVPMRVINDPLYQEWTDFRCQQMSDFYEIMATHIRRLDPGVAVVNNPHRGLSGYNTMWEQGVDYPRLLAHTDMVWTEEGNAASFSNDILISKIRSYKMARTLNNRVLTYTSDSKLEMAESMAYNRQGMGMVGGLAEMEANSKEGKAYELQEEQQAYIRFFHDNFQYYRDIKPVADVAVLRSFATMAYNNGRPYQSTLLFEQSLIQANIPFDIIFDDQLKDLSKYKVLILADQECMDDAKLDLIRSFVKEGGGLIATEHTSLYTEWRQRKRDFGLRDLFQVNAPEWHGSNPPEAILDVPIQKNKIGEGRVVYIPEIQPVISRPPAAPMTSKYWKLPGNWTQLIEAVEWASDGSLSLEVDAPPYVTTEVMEKADRSALMLHLLNFNFAETTAHNIKVKVRIPEGRKIKNIVVLSPDGGPDENLRYEVRERNAVFTVPSLSVYNMVVMRLE